MGIPKNELKPKEKAFIITSGLMIGEFISLSCQIYCDKSINKIFILNLNGLDLTEDIRLLRSNYTQEVILVDPERDPYGSLKTLIGKTNHNDLILVVDTFKLLISISKKNLDDRNERFSFSKDYNWEKMKETIHDITNEVNSPVVYHFPNTLNAASVINKVFSDDDALDILQLDNGLKDGLESEIDQIMNLTFDKAINEIEKYKDLLALQSYIQVKVAIYCKYGKVHEANELLTLNYNVLDDQLKLLLAELEA